MKKIIGVLKWTAIVIVAAFILLVIARIPHAIDAEKTKEQVAIIRATKLTLDDVMGKNLPPDPGAEADKTVAGIDANKNGIRDDVELAIFKEYPNSAKTRAVLLQYALTLQMDTIQPFINEQIATAVRAEQSRANYCVGEITSRGDLKKFIKVGDELHGFVETRQLNTQARINARQSFVKSVRSYSTSNSQTCDVTLTVLAN